MKFFLALSIIFLPFSRDDLNSITVIRQMYNCYHGNWQRTIVFNQLTERYRNDSLIKSQTWYEQAMYPDMLRIDFDKPNSSNGVIYRHDSTYVFNNNKLVKSVRNENELMFFLGGLYFMPFDNVLKHFGELKYDLGKFHEDVWKGRSVYVIGADKTAEHVNQLWIDKKMLVPVRFIKYDDNRVEEGLFENQIQLKKEWDETLCKFYIDGHLLQVEKYHNVVAGAAIDSSIFDPAMFTKSN